MNPFRRRATRGFSLVELLIAGSVVAIAGMAGVAYVSRATQNADYSRDQIYARQKALSILSELRAYVEGGKGEVAADLDGFDDGLYQNATLSIAPDPNDPGAFIGPDDPLSGNIADLGEWRWYRRITVRRFPGLNTRDLRICTVRMFRHRPGGDVPGMQMAEVSSVVRTIGDSYPTTQVYDVYLLALENIPGWWVYLDSIKPFIDTTLQDLEARNPGLEFRTHWITTAAYGRDERYAPYTNEARDSVQNTPWAYLYPGKMPAGSASARYYVPKGFRARMNLDGEFAPTFLNEYATSEPYSDDNGNGKRDPGEPYTDVDGDSYWDPGNEVPYALADQQNHAMRWPEENAKFAARVDAGNDVADAPTWRLLLDQMIADPDKFHNAIFVNMHGELLPMPAVRNYSDAAKDPVAKPGWRVVTHPERLRPRRVAGDYVNSDRLRWRVYGYKTEFTNAEALTTQQEPWSDLDASGAWNPGEPYQDWNGDGQYSAATPITVTFPGLRCDQNPNPVVGQASIMITRTRGGIDANGDAIADPYGQEWATRYPEPFTDANGDGRCDVVEAYFDQNGDGLRGPTEPWAELDGNGAYSPVAEAFTDANANGRFDGRGGSDVYTDWNANGKWDAAEPYWDANGNGLRDGPTNPTPPPWQPWDPAVDDASPFSRSTYVANFGEPFNDVDGNGVWSAAEPLLYDRNGNGVYDGGWRRGEMWYEIAWDGARNETVLTLHGTPLLCPETGTNQGLDATARLYDLDYVPCPMINSAASTGSMVQFERDLMSTTADVPKNTARWLLEVPLAHYAQATETVVGSSNGDAVDRILQVDTRLGTDRTTGAMWPASNKPENVSRSYCYFYADSGKVPFSERYQFNGDPRHCPYADTDRFGASFPNGYNWYFDNFMNGADHSGKWLSLDGGLTGRLRARWRNRNCFDTARYFSWLRTAMTKTEAIWTTLTGFSYYYLSIGNDIGYDSANGYPSSIPVDGAPYGSATDVFEDTIAGGGTAGLGGSQKYVRSNNGAGTGIRSGGYWWSKPWIGELCQDGAFAGQWAAWGNLRAATGTGALTYRRIRRADVTTAQQPPGTVLLNAIARTQEEGCTSFFNIGTSGSTFHHQYQDGQTGALVGDGPQLAANYNFPIPTTAGISRPFGLATNTSGGVGDEFSYTTEYPRYSATKVVDFFNHTNGQTGSALVRHSEPGASPRAAFVVVNGIDRTTGSGSAFIARYSLLTQIHSYFAAGLSASNRVKQLPRLQIKTPTIVTELNDPSSVAVSWKVEWKRWDGLKYTANYADSFTEPENTLAYVLVYSRDNGKTWLNMMTEEPIEPGVLPWIAGVGPDPARTRLDVGAGDESWSWPTPAATFPEGTYIVRLQAFRTTESMHYSQHQEKIYVNR